MQVVPLPPETIRISFGGLSTSLKTQPGNSCSQLRNAADIEVKLVTEVGSCTTARGHLSAEHGAVLDLAIAGAVAVSSLTVELSEGGFGNVVAIGAATSKSFRALSVGNLELALICPDVLKFAGSLEASFIRSGPKLAKLAPIVNKNKEGNTNTDARLVPAGLLADGNLAAVPPSVTLRTENGHQANVSRSALVRLPPDTLSTSTFGSFNDPVVLQLCAGETDLPGGKCDLNLLAANAVHALADTSNGVVALATEDVAVATVLMAVAPENTAVIWTHCARKDVPKRLRMPASVHRDFHSGTYVELKKKKKEENGNSNNNNTVLVLPPKLLDGQEGNSDAHDTQNENRLKRKKSSVRWASPLSTRCTSEHNAGSAA